ncbi:MAG: NADAR family protein, partial [Candidatus Moraniibacteriota bacterium]
MGERVLFYSEHDPLSNFYVRVFVWQGKEWRSAEHAYQAAKFFNTDPEIAEAIRTALTSAEAKHISKTHRARRQQDWTAKKLSIMEDILRTMLVQDDSLRALLISTG